MNDNNDSEGFIICPLNIPLVLSNVFKVLSVCQLKKCRLVCRLWNEEICKILQKDSKLFISDSDNSNPRWDLNEPFSSIKHICQSVHFDSSIQPEQVLNFMVGNKNSLRYIKYLNLTGHYHGSSTWLKDVLFSQSYLVNSLEELSLTIPAFFENESLFESSADISIFQKLWRLYIFDRTYSLTFSSPVIWKQNIFRLLLSAPNLTTLVYLPFHEPRARMFFEAMQSVPLRRLKHFHINHLEFFKKDLEFFAKKQFRLQYLHLVLTKAFPCESLNELIHLPSLKNSLSGLTLTFKDNTKLTDYEEFDCPETLRRISLLTYEGKLVILGSSKYEVDLTKLVTLVLSLPDEIIETEDLDGINCNLKELEIFDVPVKFIPENVITMFKIFKTITRLTLNFVNCEILKIIYEFLPFLQALCVVEHKLHGQCDGEEVEAGLIGLEEDTFDREEQKDQVPNVLPGKYSGIGKLKDLATLKLEVSGLSDLSVTYALVHCESLTSLTLKNIDAHSPVFLSDFSLQVFADSMNLFYLKLEKYTENCSQEAISQLSEKMKWKELHIIPI